MADKKQQFRNALFTLNNYTSLEVEHLMSLTEKEDVRYIIFSKEVGESGTPHLQGYIELLRRKTLASLGKLLTPEFIYGANNSHRVHIERRRGTQHDSISYTIGGDDHGKPVNNWIFEYGKPAKSKSEDAVARVRQALKGDDSIYRTLNDEFTIEEIKAYEVLERYRPYPGLRDAPYIEWVWGPPGAGKSRHSRDANDGHDIYVVPFSLDGYWERYARPASGDNRRFIIKVKRRRKDGPKLV